MAIFDIGVLDTSFNLKLYKINLYYFLALLTQLSPEIFDQRKMDTNCLEANFGYFRLSIARDDKNNENCPSSFLVYGQKLVKFCFEPKKVGKKSKKLSGLLDLLFL